MQMCNISIFFQISSVLAGISTAPTNISDFAQISSMLLYSFYYCQVVLEKGLLSDIRAKCCHHKLTLQQAGVTSHGARRQRTRPI